MPEEVALQYRAFAKLLSGFVISLMLTFPAGANPVNDVPDSDDLCDTRDNDVSRLQSSGDNLHSWHMCDFTPPSHPVTPVTKYGGTLSLQPVGAGSYMRILRDEFSIAKIPGVSRFPRVVLEFVQNGTDFIPVQRGTVANQHPYWETIFEPGKIWRDLTDPESSRVALPFSLQERNANCIHNGVMTFLITPDNKVDSLRYQVSGETCAYFQFDMWGTLQAQYQAGSISNSRAIINSYLEEISVRLPVRNFKTLKQTYPQVNIQNLLARNPEYVSVFGMVINGVNYRSSCKNRFGNYPFCEVLDLPSFSTAKSIFAALAMMRLEKLYPGTMQLTVGELVDECQKNDSWKDVTLSHLLNMTSGHYRSKTHEKDENSNKTRRFFLSEHHDDKIQLACTLYPRRKNPGKQWVYHSTDTYLAGTLMNQFLRTKTSALAMQQTDIYRDVIVKDIWQPLSLSPVLNTTRRTYDASSQPFTGWGLTYHLDDILRLSMFINEQAKLTGGQSMFSEPALRAALQKDSDNRGLEAINSKFRYNNGFWAYNIGSEIQCKHALWVPFMSGYGGITVAMFPNGVIYYAYSDNHEFAWINAAVEANKITPMCAPHE